MPTTIFDWIFRTAMLVMAGLVTLSILGSIAAMTNDPGTRFATADRSTIGAAPAPGQEQEQEQEQERAAAQAPPLPGDGNPAVAPAQGPGTTAVAARPSREENEERWLEAIAYALLALAGVGAIGVLMLWRAVRELRRIAGSREVSR